MTSLPSLEELLKKGVHFGHKTSKRHPKMMPYIFAKRSGVYIIDLQKTSEKLQEALAFVDKVVKAGGQILFIGSKKQAREIVQEAAVSCQMPYIIGRWLGGTFTNFENIFKLTQKLYTLEKDRDGGVWERYTKKEQVALRKELAKLEENIGGIREMKKLPQAIFVVDIKKEKTAVAEANKVKIPIISLVDTNTNPESVNYPIPANDDAVKSIEIITNAIAQAVNEAREKK